MPNVKLDHCVIHVTDWKLSNDFYRDVIRAEIMKIGNGWVYQFGDTRLNVHGPGVDPHPVARLPVLPGGSDLCFVWPGPIEEAEAHLARHGLTVELGPEERAGARGIGVRIYFRDPDGSLLEFISYAEA